MPNRLARSIPAIIVALVASVVLVMALVQSSVAGPGADVSRGTATCRTDSAGYCSVEHAFGQVPGSAVLTPVFYPSTKPFFMGLASSGSTATTLRVRAFLANGGPVVGAIEFSYSLAAGPVTPPTTTTTTTTVTTTTTATPPPPSGYPTAATTGVPVGTVFGTVINGNYTVTEADAVLDSWHITGALLIEAPNVVVRRSQVDNEIQNWRTPSASFTVEDSTIGPESGCIYQAGVYGHHFTVSRAHIRNKANGFTLTNGGHAVVRDSYVHPCTLPGDDTHTDGFETCCNTIGDNYDVITLDHNTIDTRGGASVTAAVDLDKAVQQTNVTVTNNLVAGGAFTMYLDSAGQVKNPHWVVSGNRWIDGAWAFGPLVTRDSTCSQVDWSDNAVVTVDADYRITSTVRALSCDS
jgi:hypothetical protein